MIFKRISLSIVSGHLEASRCALSHHHYTVRRPLLQTDAIRSYGADPSSTNDDRAWWRFVVVFPFSPSTLALLMDRNMSSIFHSNRSANTYIHKHIPTNARFLWFMEFAWLKFLFNVCVACLVGRLGLAMFAKAHIIPKYIYQIGRMWLECIPYSRTYQIFRQSKVNITVQATKY